MATKQQTVDFVVEQVAGAGAVSQRKMFGEYTLYCDGKVVALVSDDQLYVKPTKAGRAIIGGGIVEKPPYAGAKPWFWIAGERWDEGEWLSGLIRASAAELPMPAPKPGKRKRV